MGVGVGVVGGLGLGLELVEVDIGVVSEHTPLAVLVVVLGHGGPDTVPALLLVKLEGEGGMPLRPPVLVRDRGLPERSGARARAGLEGLVGERDRCGVGDGEAQVGEAVGGAGVEDGRVALEELGDAGVVGVVAYHEHLERGAVCEVEGDARVRAGAADASELLAD